MTKAFIAFGANLGDAGAMFQKVAAEIGRFPGTDIVRKSPLYQTRAVGGPPGQPVYTNGVLEVVTQIPLAADFFERLASLESELGRERTLHWGPRNVDLDLLLFEEEIIETPKLLVPHPRMHFRSFVLRPLLDLAPEAIHPVLGHTVASLWRRLTAQPLTLVPIGTPEFLEVAGELVRRVGQRSSLRLLSIPRGQVAAGYVGPVVVGVGLDHEGATVSDGGKDAAWVVLGGPLTVELTPAAARVPLVPCVDCRAETTAEQIEKLEHFFASATAVYDGTQPAMNEGSQNEEGRC